MGPRTRRLHTSVSYALPVTDSGGLDGADDLDDEDVSFDLRSPASTGRQRENRNPDASLLDSANRFNDDDEERRVARARRRSLIDSGSRRRSVTTSHFAENAKERASEESDGKKMSDEQLSELYSMTIKLCLENRVNMSNSWKLDLIDYIANVASARGLPSKSNPSDETGDADGEGGLETNFVLAGSNS